MWPPCGQSLTSRVLDDLGPRRSGPRVPERRDEALRVWTACRSRCGHWRRRARVGPITVSWLWTDDAGTASEVLTSFGHNRQRAKSCFAQRGTRLDEDRENG